MKMSFQKQFCTFAFFFFTWSTVFASGYPVSTYLGIDQGLSNNSVRCIYQDHNGFMWFGTYDGLNRYDGYEFKVFRNNFKSNQSLVNNWINAMSEDAKGNLWIGARQGACMYQSLSNSFSPVYYYASGNKVEKLTSVIRDVEQDQRGNMLIGTEDIGLLYFPKGHNTGYRILLDDSQSNDRYLVSAIKVSGDDRTWFFTNNQGLCEFDYKTKRQKSSMQRSRWRIVLSPMQLIYG